MSGRTRSVWAWAGVQVVTLVLAIAAVMSTTPAESTSAMVDRSRETQELIVFAAASLADAFEAVGSAFERTHPNTRVRFNFAGSQQLASQILDEAQADVFASADGRQMQAVSATLAIEPRPFAANELVIAVERGNPLRVRGLADLSRSDLTVVLAAEEVPAGRYARQALERSKVKVEAASLENDVRTALFKVRLGEADAAIVYASDLVAAGDSVTGVPILPEANVVASYPIAVLERARNPDAGQAFVAFVQSVEGQAVLQRYGFSLPIVTTVPT